MEVYVYVILVKSKRLELHINNLTEAFKVFKRSKMKLNLTKCVFGVSSRKFSGFMGNQQGMEFNLDKIIGVRDMEHQKNLK